VRVRARPIAEIPDKRDIVRHDPLRFCRDVLSINRIRSLLQVPPNVRLRGNVSDDVSSRAQGPICVSARKPHASGINHAAVRKRNKKKESKRRHAARPPFSGRWLPRASARKRKTCDAEEEGECVCVQEETRDGNPESRKFP